MAEVHLCTHLGKMDCTATVRGDVLGTRDLESYRCQRPIGHPGLHHIVYDGYVKEFPDSKCYFPHYSVGN